MSEIYTTTKNTDHPPDQSHSDWHYLFTGMYMTDFDIVEYDYFDGEPYPIAMMDAKNGNGKTYRSFEWSAIKLQINAANKLEVPFFMLMNYLSHPEIPCVFMVAGNALAEKFFASIKNAPITEHKGHQGIWLSPYHYCWVLYQLRNKKMKNDTPINEKHLQSPILAPLINKFNIKILGNLPKKTLKNVLVNNT